jgi:hypothetical protein
LERKARRLLREDGAGETPEALCAEEAPRTARGKRSAWSGNQQTSSTGPFLVNVNKWIISVDYPLNYRPKLIEHLNIFRKYPTTYLFHAKIKEWNFPFINSG